MVGGVGNQGLSTADATKLYYENSAGNQTTTDMMQCQGSTLGEKVLNYVKGLTSGQIGGSSGSGASQAGGALGQQGSFVDANGQVNQQKLAQLLGSGNGMFPEGTSALGGALGTSGSGMGGGGTPGFSQNMVNGVGNFLGA